MDAHPRHRPERHKNIFVKAEAAGDQDECADRAQRLERGRYPGLVVKFRRALVHSRIDRFRCGHQLSIRSFRSSKEISSTPSCCSFALKVGDSPPTTATASVIK